MKLKKKSALLAAASFAVAVVGVIGARLLITGKKLDDDATSIIQHLAYRLDLYQTGLIAFVDNNHPNETPQAQFTALNAILRTREIAPWDIFGEVSLTEPEKLTVFVSASIELLMQLQRRLPVCGLTTDHKFLPDEAGGSLCINLSVQDPNLIALTRSKLGLP